MSLHVLYIFRPIRLLKDGSYDTMMSSVVSVMNRNMLLLRKEQEDGHIRNGKIQEYPLININHTDWITLKDTRKKVIDLLWAHDVASGSTGRSNKEAACIDPISLVLIHRNAKNMIKKLKPRVCCFYYPCTSECL